MKYCSLFLLSLASCSSHLLNSPASDSQSCALVNEVREEVSDLKHSLRSVQVSLQILEEQLQNQDLSLASIKNQLHLKNPKYEMVGDQLSVLEKKIFQIEKTQEKIVSDLRTLNTTSQQALQKAHEVDQNLEEVTKLKTTLNSLSKAMQPSSPKKYKVRQGETLEKIARDYHTTVSALKKHNHLQHDRIFIGQELEIPSHD